MASSLIENMCEINLEDMEDDTDYQVLDDFDQQNESFRQIGPIPWMGTYKTLRMEALFAHERSIQLLWWILCCLIGFFVFLIPFVVLLDNHKWSVTCGLLMFMMLFFLLMCSIKVIGEYYIEEYIARYALMVVPPEQMDIIQVKGMWDRDILKRMKKQDKTLISRFRRRYGVDILEAIQVNAIRDGEVSTKGRARRQRRQRRRHRY